MPASYEIKFLPDGETRTYCGSRGNYYELEDGTHIDVEAEPVWCHRCNDFADGESIEGLEEIDQQLADLRDPTSQVFQFFRDSWSGSLGVDGIRFITGLVKRRRWREGRQSPPKCLKCGSTEILLLPDGEKVKNPAGPGWVEINISGLCSTSFNNWYFTPEGDRIPRDTQPTYWTLPE